MPQISVIMPIYNTTPTHLNSAIQSILAQSFTDFEFIILNDSPENTSLTSLVNTYQDKRIRYLKNPTTQGIAKSYNRLLESANAPYIAMMNHDDIAHPDRLLKQYIYLKENPNIVLCGTGYKKFGEINRFRTITPPLTDSKIRAMLLFKSPIHHPTIMFRHKTAIKHHIRYNEAYISLNDRQFYYDMSQHGALANIPQALYKYRFHPQMTSKTHKSQIINEQKSFHRFWFKANHITLSENELNIFDNYITSGRCKIKSKETLNTLHQTLETLVALNTQQHFAPEPEFSAICAKYLEKRCLNGALYGKISTQTLLNNTTLPVHPSFLLNLANFALSWRN